MQQNHAPPANKAEIVQQLNTLDATDQRARFRALLPLIDQLVRRGVTHAKIVETLINAGVPVTILSLRQALYRWRKRTGPMPIDENRADIRSTPGTAADLPGAVPVTRSSSASGINSKADLVRLSRASDPIDLNELAELGRKK
ncbi:hypothetical protein [Achromobacter spanius]|uniref:KfrA N-terminal DNA-binding domain-containing protein n=1 Tax=Achromobacter spanius TaxID=217203 RepID=A0AAW3HZ87_9BURK|nr:hypothetical protein [Achromobacter spanius]KNE25796.1 hypothetical protein AFM18_20435 [Achromobacter spanius]